MLKTLADSKRRIQALSTAGWPTDRVLIIKERPETDPSVLNKVVPKQARRLVVDDKNMSVRRDIVTANENNTWLVIDIKADLASDSVTAIKEISRGAVHGGDDTWHDLTPGFRLVAVIEPSMIDKQSYPNFLNLFDTAIRVD